MIHRVAVIGNKREFMRATSRAGQTGRQAADGSLLTISCLMDWMKLSGDCRIVRERKLPNLRGLKIQFRDIQLAGH